MSYKLVEEDVMCFLVEPRHHLVEEGSGENGGSFYFIQLSDTHWGKGRNLEQTDKIVQAVNKLPFDIKCVIHTGDITEEALTDQRILDQGLKIMKKLKMPVQYVSGNNDVTGDLERVEFTKQFGELITHAEYEGVIIITITTEPLRNPDSLGYGYYLPLAQLEHVLSTSNGKPVIIAHHGECVDDFYKNEVHGTKWNEDIKNRWIVLINKYNVKAVLAGHFHRDGHHWLGDVPLYITSSVDESHGEQSTYRIFHYDKGRLSYRTQYVR